MFYMSFSYKLGKFVLFVLLTSMKMRKHVELMLNIVNRHLFLKFFQSMVFNFLDDLYCMFGDSSMKS